MAVALPLPQQRQQRQDTPLAATTAATATTAAAAVAGDPQVAAAAAGATTDRWVAHCTRSSCRSSQRACRLPSGSSRTDGGSALTTGSALGPYDTKQYEHDEAANAQWDEDDFESPANIEQYNLLTQHGDDAHLGVDTFY